MKRANFTTISTSMSAKPFDFNEIGNVNPNVIDRIQLITETLEEAEKIASTFPKYTKAEASTLVCCVSRPEENVYGISFHFNCFPNEVTGEVNESVVKRRNKIIEIIKTILN